MDRAMGVRLGGWVELWGLGLVGRAIGLGG